jgi:hypothetical protein
MNGISWREEKITPRLTLVEYEFKDVHPSGKWNGCYFAWNYVMGQICLTKKQSFWRWLFYSAYEEW